MAYSHFKGTHIEYHILQSFPVTCLNRDDVGAPKSAIVGGVSRARVSSQCWKRQVRLALQELDIKLGIRTKKLSELFTKSCIEAGANEKSASCCGKKIASLLSGSKEKSTAESDDSSDATLLFVSESEAKAFAEYAKELGFDDGKIKDKELAKRAKKVLNPNIDALDIALFGRMVAKVADMNVEAAACFSHAISTHKISNEVEFFTALDDHQEEQGSAHMGSLEFNSATYYRYISLNLGQLMEACNGNVQDLQRAVVAFTKALFIAVPAARQTTQSGASPWEFARVVVRTGQRLQASFENPVKHSGEGYLEPSINILTKYLDDKEKSFGSLYGEIAKYDWGRDPKFSIDDLLEHLQNDISKAVKV